MQGTFTCQRSQQQEHIWEHTSINGIKEVCALLGLLDVSVNQERVGLGVNVLNHDLETIEAAGLGNLHFSTESLQQVLVDNAIGSGKESQDTRDEEAFIISQAVVPVVKVLREIDFLSGPEGGFGLLVHLPDLYIATRRVSGQHSQGGRGKIPLYA